MRKSIHVSPPKDFETYSPSELFRFFFQLGHWTDDSFSDALQTFTGGNLVSTVTISKWKNKNVIPTRYSGPILNLIKNSMEINLANDWQTAFETVWARHSSGRNTRDIDSAKISSSDKICAQHKKWIRRLYHQTVPGETHSVSDIYIPLQLYNMSHDTHSPMDVDTLAKSLTKPQDVPSNRDWVFVSGAPGSGKSVTALHLANTLCDTDIFLIYIRCSQLSDIEIDIVKPDQLIVDSFSISSFLKHFRASSFLSACLILDGIEGIYGNGHKSYDGLNRLLSNLKIEKSVCDAHEKTLRIVCVGRESHVEYATAKLNAADTKHLAMLPMSGCLTDSVERDCIIGEDVRSIWWRKYLIMNKHPNDPSLPDFLCVQYDDFLEFGTVPALAHLLCQAAFAEKSDMSPSDLPHEIVNAFTYTSNKNKIYKIILDRFIQDRNSSLENKRVFCALQKLAIAMWHNPNNRNKVVNGHFEHVQDQETRTVLEAINPDGEIAFTTLNLLMTDQNHRPVLDDFLPLPSAIGITHNSITEYLISTAIFDGFRCLVVSFHEREGFERALKNWINLSCKGNHQPSLSGFLQREATLRYENFLHIEWDASLSILKEHIAVAAFDGLGVNGLAQLRTSYSLLFFVWSCLNLERQKRTGTHFKVSNKSSVFHAGDLKSIQQLNGLVLESTALMDPILRRHTFLTSSLSAIHLSSADMSQLSFSLGHIENSIFENSSFAMTHWSHVKFSHGHLYRSDFQRTLFHQIQILNTEFSNCMMQGASFQGGIFSNCEFKDTYFSQCQFSDIEFFDSSYENIIFDRCVFSRTIFSRMGQEESLRSVIFRHCTFLDMEKVVDNIPVDCLENSIE